MKDFGRYIYLCLRFGLLTTYIIANNLGCTSPFISQTDQTTPSAHTLQPTEPTTIKLTEAPSEPPGNESGQPTVTPPINIGWEMLGQVNKERVLNDLRKLTGEEPICDSSGCTTISNRRTGSEGLQAAKKYIGDELNKLGYVVEVFNWSNSGYADQNIIIRKPGISTPGEEVYFVAHMDGVKKGLGNHFPAADDNASGVVDLLEMARVISNYSFNRTLVLFFSSGEEQGTLGVKSYLSQLSLAESGSIKYAIDVDMVGYDANGDTVMELWHGDDPASRALAQVISETIKNYKIALAPSFVKGCG